MLRDFLNDIANFSSIFVGRSLLTMSYCYTRTKEG